MFLCELCFKQYASGQALSKHRRVTGGACVSVMSNEEHCMLRPSEASKWKVHCTICTQDVAKRYIHEHFKRYHPDFAAAVKTWHVWKDASSAKHQKDLDVWSHFELQWSVKQNLVEAAQPAPIPLPPPLPEMPEVDPFEQPAPHDEPEEVEEVSRADGGNPPLELEVEQVPRVDGGNPASEICDPRSLQVEVVESEQRRAARIDTIVQSFNVILWEGLGEVQAKYEVALADFVEEFRGKVFPRRKLATNYNIDDFKLTIFEYRGLDWKTASDIHIFFYIYRDVRRFLGCFHFPDQAGDDLSNLVVSIFKGRLLKRLVQSSLWQFKKSYCVSLFGSLKHFVSYLLNEERVHRAFGGLTTALTNLQQVIVQFDVLLVFLRLRVMFPCVFVILCLL